MGLPETWPHIPPISSSDNNPVRYLLCRLMHCVDVGSELPAGGRNVVSFLTRAHCVISARLGPCY